MYREGPNGFNIPYGNYKNPTIIDYNQIFAISKLIHNVNFIQSDFKNSIIKANEGDFVYLDPPYVPINDKSFVNYTKNGFNLDQHKSLFNLVNNSSANILMSNSNVKLVHEYFDKNKYTYDIIKCKRSINSKKPGSTTDEVLINNIFN